MMNGFSMHTPKERKKEKKKKKKRKRKKTLFKL